MKRYIFTYPLSICCIVLIFILCFCKPSSLPIDMPSIIGFDKVCHLIMYLGTCSVIWTEYLRYHNRIAWLRCLCWAVIAPALMSIGIEWGQAFLTDYRGYDLYDVYANLAGIVLALLVPYGWTIKR